MTTEQKNNHALILRTNGEFEIIDWPASGTLETLRTAIGCDYVQAVNISPRLTIWMDEDGTGKHVNHAATMLHVIHADLIGHHHGTAVITSGPDGEGTTQGLTQDDVTGLAAFFLTFTGARIPSQRTK
ncbi:DUF3846 domain-containing protein [Streptomyces parvus]|uniref:DUF3846 domain-containing protein n=1 Tax=Streptomyces parvus TaxID=66428 RepID=UPI0037FF8893